jgi:uncharacterized membrane protein (UPF0127 family)
MKYVLLIPLLLIAILCQGCGQQPGTLPMVSMKIGNQTFQIEVARTPAQQEKGLMERDTLPEDHGMIFVFDEAKVVGFWMKNTRFPLDIIFLDSSGRIVSIHQMKEYDTRDQTSSDYPARYAIELNKGAASLAGLKVGDRITIPPEAVSK